MRRRLRTHRFRAVSCMCNQGRPRSFDKDLGWCEHTCRDGHHGTLAHRSDAHLSLTPRTRTCTLHFDDNCWQGTLHVDVANLTQIKLERVATPDWRGWSLVRTEAVLIPVSEPLLFRCRAHTFSVRRTRREPRVHCTHHRTSSSHFKFLGESACTILSRHTQDRM